MLTIRRLMCFALSLGLLLFIIQFVHIFSHEHPQAYRSVTTFLGLDTAPVPAVGKTEGTCSRFEELGLYRQAETDFAHYKKKGLSPENQTNYRNFCKTVLRHSCITVIILRGRIFVKHFYPGYQSRHRSTIYAIYQVAKRFGPLPDAEFVIEVTDGYLGGLYDLPVFMITRPAETQVGILYPDFTFFNWPEAVCPPERSHGYGYLYSLYEREAKKMDAKPDEFWAGKEDILFWRGGHIHNVNRDNAVKIFKNMPAVDMAFMEWHNWTVTGINGAPGCVGLLDACKYRYLAFLNGNTYSSRFKFNLLCGSCVFASRQMYVEWWSQLFRAGEDYVEVKEDWSDAPQQHEKVRRSADGGLKIARSAQKKALQLLSEDAVDCYWLRLIELASKNLPRPANVEFEDLPASTKPIEDVLHYANDVTIGDEGLVGGGLTVIVPGR